MKDNIILLGSDHLGLSLKNSLKNHLQDKGYKVEDVGAVSYTHLTLPTKA